MSVTPEDVRHVARLARLVVPDDRLPALVAELNGILGHMDVLQQVDLNEQTGTSSVRSTPLRDDEIPAETLQRPREAFAPAMRDGFFLVPRLATHGQSGASADRAGDDA